MKSKTIAPDRLSNRKPSMMPWVVPILCDGCTACVNRCPRGLLKMTATNVKDVYVPWLAEPNLCTGCRHCTEACVMGAISMTSYVEDAARRFVDQKPTLPTELTETPDGSSDVLNRNNPGKANS